MEPLLETSPDGKVRSADASGWGSVSNVRLILERVEVQIGVGLLHRLLDVFAYQTLSSSVITSFMTDRVCGMLIFFEVFYLNIFYFLIVFDYIYIYIVLHVSIIHFWVFNFYHFYFFPFYIC